MCGIVGFTGQGDASEILLTGLKRLEYRGYDSAGIALHLNKMIKVYKRKGKIKDLREIVPEGIGATSGIGHTRWATHGEVNDNNAHPHIDCSGKIAVVHNGIIENYVVLKKILETQGCVFRTQTDSEVIAHLLEKNYHGDLEKAVKTVLPLLKGTYGVVCTHADEPGRLVGARNGSPLVLGVATGAMYLASDVTALLAYTKEVIYLEDGEIISLDEKGYNISNLKNQEISKEIAVISWELDQIEKGDFEHFMEKEILEQPEAIRRGFQGRINHDMATAHLGGLDMSNRDLLNIGRVKFIAAGTSFHAGMVGAYLLESLARLPSVAELASEVRYRNPLVEKDAIYFAVSQSGETADTLYALRELQRKGAKVLGVCNVIGSSIARESDGGSYIHSGPEIAVASTKAFTSQITIFYLYSILMARVRDMSWETGQHMIKTLEEIPEKIERVLAKKEEMKALAKKYRNVTNMLFLGRGINYPVALEGALKLKEISYIHAEGYSAAEIKHGPIALINEDTPSLFLVPDDSLRDKIISNIKEIKARKGKVIAIAVEGDDEVADIVDDVFFVPKVEDLFYPFLMVVPLQLFAYYMARELGRDVDQPRNLAKSVTVE